jgi:hypothetical protein
MLLVLKVGLLTWLRSGLAVNKESPEDDDDEEEAEREIRVGER